MNIPRKVIVDLLPLYLAGEISQETREFVEQYLKTDPELAALAEQSDFEFPGDVPMFLTKEDQMKALDNAKRYAFWRTVILAVLASFMVLALVGGVIFMMVFRTLY